MAELKPIAPAEAKEMYLAQRRGEVAESTLQAHHYRLKPFVQWCESTSLTNPNELSARDLHKYRFHRKEEDDLNKVTLRTQLSAIRVFVKFLESIDGVEQGLHDNFVLTGNVYDEFTSVESRSTVVREVQDNYSPNGRNPLSQASRSL
ncbi:hypothetical protein GCM10009037_16320 [Halarchaeum grantii]|uniref:Core-binding (CB) domain-containing protein n=1 Tax=Halarchaeum grantii TaxID=1193105 RepID=A0A830F9Y8_9EURY|nr:site-specific integrase [Halarchaeum grantii]GGL33407.1 hypothetical protein GCM10009037_16320 [Halarchaeum grantii]